MKQVISKKELNELEERFKGKEERGLPFKSEATYILKKEGEKGLKRLEDTMAGLGYPIKYEEVKLTNFYPAIIEVLTLISIKKLFNYDDKKFQEIGEFSVKLPQVIRTVAVMRKYFSPSKELLNRITLRIWRNYFLWGDLTILEYDEKKKYAILIIKNYPNHPLNCQVITGGIRAVFKVVIGTKTTCKETKCTHRNDDHHEFLIKW